LQNFVYLTHWIKLWRILNNNFVINLSNHGVKWFKKNSKQRGFINPNIFRLKILVLNLTKTNSCFMKFSIINSREFEVINVRFEMQKQFPKTWVNIVNKKMIEMILLTLHTKSIMSLQRTVIIFWVHNSLKLI
jgi:glutamine synthetase type III